MIPTRTVVLRLTSTDRLEGVWMVVESYPTAFDLHRHGAPLVRLVPTGSVEWDGNRCAEVYVPENRLSEWRAEFDVDA